MDTSRAFRQLKVDTGDIDLLGIKSNNYYLDLLVPLGFRSGSGFFQRCSDSIRFIMSKKDYPALINYINDLVHCDLPSKMHDACQFLLQLLKKLGLSISHNKWVALTTSVVCFGTLVDTITHTISIPPEKLQQIHKMCKPWKYKKNLY